MKKIHLICNAHLDPIWQWSWDEGISAALSTFKSACDLAEHFDYVFCHGESLLYEAIEQYAPSLFERIKKLVKEGKWQVTGGWYLQPDCNMPSGESIVRQIEVGQKYFREKFGIAPTVATNYDAFGHSIGLVQILKKCGYNGYIHTRPLAHQFDWPDGTFYKWTSPDGSSLIATRSPGYNTGMGHSMDKILRIVEEAEDVDYVLWGVGNHGGGPSAKDLQDIQDFTSEDVQLIHSTPEALFADAIEVKNEIKRSLTPCMPGCYSSMAKVKRMHREVENLYFGVEKMLSVASLSGFDNVFDKMKHAEKQLLLSQFHDILPGSCVKAGEDEGLELLSAAKKTLTDYRTKAFLQLVMPNAVAAEGEYPVFVFNYMPYPVTTPVEVEFTLADQNWDDAFNTVSHVYDMDGREVVSQQIKEESTLNLDWRKKIVFEGTLKPLAVTRFSIRTEKLPTESIQSQKDMIPDSIPASLEMYEDSADPWAMGDDELHNLGKNPRKFRQMTAEESAAFCKVQEIAPVHVIESGDVLKTTQSFLTCGNTNAVLDYITYKNQPYTDIKVTVEFADKNELLRLLIPMPEGKVIGDGPFIVEEKTDGEITFQKWVGVEKPDGKIVSVINDGSYAGTVRDGALCVSLLRGSGYCFHPICDRELYPQDRYLPRIDCGRYVFKFRIFEGDMDEVTAQAELFNAQPYAVNVFPISGGVKAADVHTDKAVSMSAFRKNEDGSILLRFFNPKEIPDSFNLTLDGKTKEISMAPFEIVTVKYKDGIFTIEESLI